VKSPESATSTAPQNRNETPTGPTLYQNCPPSRNDPSGFPRATTSSSAATKSPDSVNAQPAQKPSSSPGAPTVAKKKPPTPVRAVATGITSPTASSQPSWGRQPSSGSSSLSSSASSPMMSPSKFQFPRRTSDPEFESTTPPSTGKIPVLPKQVTGLRPTGTKGCTLPPQTSPPTSTAEAAWWKRKDSVAADAQTKRWNVSVASPPSSKPLVSMGRSKSTTSLNSPQTVFGRTTTVSVDDDVPPELPPPRPDHPPAHASVSCSYMVSEPQNRIIEFQSVMLFLLVCFFFSYILGTCQRRIFPAFVSC